MSTLEPSSRDVIASLLDSARLSSATRDLLTVFDGSTAQLVDTLMESGAFADAITVIARALPKPFALGWACECIRALMVRGVPTHHADRMGLALAEAWLRDPTEDNRRAALDFAESGNFDGVGAWIAAAVGWTGGSMAPLGYTPVLPGKYLAADAVVTALIYLAAQMPDELIERERLCLSAARERFESLSHVPQIDLAQDKRQSGDAHGGATRP